METLKKVWLLFLFLLNKWESIKYLRQKRRECRRSGERA
uniref:Uncharacterized protein n=1 Tax=Rhizophora mucronata TaxID=61149 RepID=A0A2P2QM64_RHIMU